MRLLNKLSSITTAVVLTGSMFLVNSGLASASSYGQIESGNSNYTIANVTNNSGFSNTQTANACDVVEYRLHLYNPGPDPINDVKVEATINTVTPYTQFVSTATAFAPNSLSSQVNFQSTLNIASAQTQSYVSGSTVLLDSAGNVIKSSANGGLADTITMGAGGIDIGSLGESVQEFLEFKAQISCPAPTPTYACTQLVVADESDNTVKVTNFVTSQTNGATFSNATINWGDNSTALTSSQPINQTHQYASTGNYSITATANFNVAGSSKSVTSQNCVQEVSFQTTPPPVTPPVTPPTIPASTLVNTGPGNIVATFIGFTVAGTIASMIFMRRKLIQN